MYRLNNLYRPVLITPAEVIAKSPTSHTMDEERIRHSIEIAEERFIRPALGSGLYEAICAEKNKVVTVGNIASLQPLVDADGLVGADGSVAVLKEGQILNAAEFLSAANRKLWDYYLWKLVAECVRFTVMPDAYATLGPQGITKPNPAVDVLGTSAAKSVGIDLRDAKWLVDKWQSDRIDPLLEAMHAFICSEGGYAGYGRPCPCATGGEGPTRKTDWVTGIYDNENGCGCDW